MVSACGTRWKLLLIMSLLALAVLLCFFLLTSGLPAELECLGSRLDSGQIHLRLSPDITDEIHDCDTQWLVNNNVTAFYDSNGETNFAPPILNATASTAIIVEAAPVFLEYFFTCPQINVQRRLPCSYLVQGYPATHKPVSGNVTPAEHMDYDVPIWLIAVSVTAGALLSAIIIFLVCRLNKKTCDYVCTKGNEPV